MNSSAHDWLNLEEQQQQQQLEASFYNTPNRSRVGLTGFIFDCIAGPQDDQDLTGLGGAGQSTESSIFSNLSLSSPSQMIYLAVEGITTSFTHLFSWKQAEVRQAQVPPSSTTADLFEIVIEDEINNTLKNIQKSISSSMKPIAVSLSAGFIESPKMSEILAESSLSTKEDSASVDIAEVAVDDSEYVDAGNYWYEGPTEDANDRHGSDNDYDYEEELQKALYAMESYIDFSQDSKIIPKPLPKKNKKSSRVRVHFEPMVELMDSVVNNDRAAIKKALQGGSIQVNDRDKLGYTMIHYAASHNHTDLIKFLVDRDADINSLDYSNWTPLHLAAIADHFKACKTLLDLGANFECFNDDDCLPIDLTEDAKVKRLLADATKKKLSSKKVRAIYNWSPVEPEYLPITKAESFKVLERREAWWLLQNEQKQIGLVPRNFVQ